MDKNASVLTLRQQLGTTLWNNICSIASAGALEDQGKIYMLERAFLRVIHISQEELETLFHAAKEQDKNND